MLVCCLLLQPVAVVADSAEEEDEEEAIRSQRAYRVAQPLWRQILAAPERALDLIAAPIKHTLIWAEKENLPERLADIFYFNEERTAGWFPDFDLGTGISAAGGVRLFHGNLFGGGEQVVFSTLCAFRNFEGPSLEEQVSRLSFKLPHVAASRFDVQGNMLFSKDQDEDIFLLEQSDGSFRPGAAADHNDERSYALEQVRLHLAVLAHVGSHLRAGLAFAPQGGHAKGGAGDDPPIPSRLDGFGGPNILLGGGPLVEWDSRTPSFQPRSGWYGLAEAGYWHGVEGEASSGKPYRYTRYRLDLRRYQPTFQHDRTLVLRAFVDRVDGVDGGTIPFWDLPILDNNHFLRGFERNRFLDRGALAFNVEYRWPIWDTWDAYLFLDEGQVFRNYSDISLHAFEWAAGVGVRFYSQQGFLISATYVASEEEHDLRIRLEQDL